jgi:hypothetical protein
MAKKSNNLVMVGKVSFLIGLILALVAGVVPAVADFAYTGLILVVLGLLVGFLNIAEKDIVKLLVAIIALVAVGTATVTVIPYVNLYLASMLQFFVAFVGAAGFVVALKAVLEVTKK